MMRFGIVISFATFVASSQSALATDNINCTSASWAVMLPVGSDETVVSLVIDDITKKHFREPLTITELAKEARHVHVSTKAIDIRAKTPNGETLRITSKNGAGRIRFLKTSEKLTCDWTV